MPRRVLIVFLFGALVVATGATVATPAAAHQLGNEGCTPGFWKNHTDEWPVSTTNTLEQVFDVPDAFGLDNQTLLQALSFRGGPGLAGMARNLLRQSVAGLLAALHDGVDYPIAESQVISRTNAALNSGSRAAMEDQKNQFEGFNSLGCPI
jgi:hypothetical protein